MAAAGRSDTGFGMAVCALAPVAHKHKRNAWLSPSCRCPRGTGRTSSTSLCPPRPGQPCVLGVHLSGAWGEHECVPLCGAALGVVHSFRDAESGLEDVRVRPGWERGCEDSRSSSAAPALIDLIGAARRGWRNARWPGFSRRGEARRRRPGTGQIINVN